jgi:isopenicillin N synthase-like dioxygenase
MTHREEPYLLLKLIHYRSSGDGAPRSGVAPHVDFSWITLVLQDETGGLEIRGLDGTWKPVSGVPGTLLANVGEILEFATGGACRATPHRVVSGVRSRVSLPFFLNPGLDTRIEPVLPPLPKESDPEHVHRVFSRPRVAPFVYGDEEWQRKGLGKYCELCCGDRTVSITGSSRSSP